MAIGSHDEHKPMTKAEASVAIMKEMADESWPKESLQPALDFVLTEAVSLVYDTVTSGENVYQIHPANGCTCKSAEFRSRYCKHFVAWRMQQRVDALMELMNGDGKMAESNPQTEWEASVQNGEKVDPNEDNIGGMFDDLETEPDNIPDPVVPEALNPAPLFDGVQQTVVMTEGHQYTDYPSTLCIKRHIGHTELMWTFRGTDDTEVLSRVAAMLRRLDSMAPKQAPPVVTAPPAPGPASPSQQQDRVPMCRIHGTPMAPSQYGDGKFYCKGKKMPDGTWCQEKG